MNVIFRKIKTVFTTKHIFLKKFVGSPLMKLFPDKMALKLLYKTTFGVKLNLKNPKTFNEKLQWLKLYNRRPEYTTMVDKNAVKQYVANIIGEDYIIPTLGVWDKFEDIDFNTLPNKFVLKTTHGSGDIVICKDKNTFNIEQARKKLNKSLKKNYYKVSREWPYKNVPRKIIAEQFMEEEVGKSLTDYKIFCFNGKAKMVLLCTERFSAGGTKFNYFDRQFNYIISQVTDIPVKLERPLMLDKMFELAEKLSEGVPHLRVDFYQLGTKIYFGELTLYHSSGFDAHEWDNEVGTWITLPEKYKKTK